MPAIVRADLPRIRTAKFSFRKISRRRNPCHQREILRFIISSRVALEILKLFPGNISPTGGLAGQLHRMHHL